MMRKLTTALAVGLAALALAPGAAQAVEYFLRAAPTEVKMPDGVAVTMWGFALEAAFGNELGAVTVPGPRLTVPANDPTLTIHLDNNTPCPLALAIPGQKITPTPVRHGPEKPMFEGRVRSFTYETPPGNATDVTYTWSNLRPGTYLYLSTTHISCHVQMGLYGAVTKDDQVAGQAYPGQPYAAEVIIFYSEIDPAYTQAVTTGNYGPGKAITSPINYEPKYFLVNGQPFNGTVTPIPAGNAGQRVLVRFLNAGLKSHAPMLLNEWMTPIAEDGYPYRYPQPRTTLTLPALKTKDVIIEPTEAGVLAIVDRTLHLTNNTAPGGGMLAHLSVGP